MTVSTSAKRTKTVCLVNRTVAVEAPEYARRRPAKTTRASASPKAKQEFSEKEVEVLDQMKAQGATDAQLEAFKVSRRKRHAEQKEVADSRAAQKAKTAERYAEQGIADPLAGRGADQLSSARRRSGLVTRETLAAHLGMRGPTSNHEIRRLASDAASAERLRGSSPAVRRALALLLGLPADATPNEIERVVQSLTTAPTRR